MRVRIVRTVACLPTSRMQARRNANGLGDRGGGVAIDAKGQSIGRLSARLGQPNRDVYFAGDQRHYGFGVVAFWAFESPRIETRSFRLDDPQ